MGSSATSAAKAAHFNANRIGGTNDHSLVCLGSISSHVLHTVHVRICMYISTCTILLHIITCIEKS